MTLDELRAGVAALRNAVWGRGSTPLIRDRGLADEVDAFAASFREWADSEDWFTSPWAVDDWIDQLRQLSARARAAGVDVAPVSDDAAFSTLGQAKASASSALDALGNAIKAAGPGMLAAVGVVVVLALLDHDEASEDE